MQVKVVCDLETKNACSEKLLSLGVVDERSVKNAYMNGIMIKSLRLSFVSHKHDLLHVLRPVWCRSFVVVVGTHK